MMQTLAAANHRIQNQAVTRRFKRCNAVRVKSENLNVLPNNLRRAISRLREHQSALSQQVEEAGEVGECREGELSLLEQIRRGIKLRPVVKLRPRIDEPKKRLDGSSVANLLVKVLETRYLAMQYTDDEEDSDDEDIDDDEDADLCLGVGNFKVGSDYRSYQLFEDSTLSKATYGQVDFVMKL